MFCEGLLHTRGGTRLLAATYDRRPPNPTPPSYNAPPPPAQYTLAASWQPAPSLPLYSKLDFFSLSLSFFPFLISTFLLCWALLFVSNPIPPSFTASISFSPLLLASLSARYYLLSCSVSFLPTFANHPSPPSVCFLFSISLLSALYLSFILCSFYRSPLRLLPSFCLSSALRPLTLHFSPCLFLSPFLFSQPLSPSLWVSVLCGGSQSPVGHPAGERAEKRAVEQGQEGKAERERGRCSRGRPDGGCWKEIYQTFVLMRWQETIWLGPQQDLRRFFIPYHLFVSVSLLSFHLKI